MLRCPAPRPDVALCQAHLTEIPHLLRFLGEGSGGRLWVDEAAVACAAYTASVVLHHGLKHSAQTIWTALLQKTMPFGGYEVSEARTLVSVRLQV